jgi:hypothetical protein
MPVSRWYTLGPPGSGPALRLVGPAPFQASSVWGSRSVRLGVGPPGSGIATVWLESRRRYRSADCGACWLPLHPTRTRIRPSSGSATVWLDSSVVDLAPGHASGGASELPLHLTRTQPARLRPRWVRVRSFQVRVVRLAYDQPDSGSATFWLIAQSWVRHWFRFVAWGALAVLNSVC